MADGKNKGKRDKAEGDVRVVGVDSARFRGPGKSGLEKMLDRERAAPSVEEADADESVARSSVANVGPSGPEPESEVESRSGKRGVS